MSTKNGLALLVLVSTTGVATADDAHRTLPQPTAATVAVTCTTTYSTEAGAEGRSVSVINMICPRFSPRGSLSAPKAL